MLRLDYELDGTRPSDLVKIDILLNSDKVDALSFIATNNLHNSEHV